MRLSPRALFALCLLAFATPSSAQWATNGAQLNDASLSSPVFVADGAGGVREFCIITNEVNESGITVDGTRIWNSYQFGAFSYPTTITSVNDGTKTRLCAVSDGGGGNLIAWIDTRTGAAGTYIQRVDAGGTPRWTTNGVTVRIANKDGGEIAICSDGRGGAFVAFQPRVVTPSPRYPLVLQHVLDNGTLAWGGGVGVSDLIGTDSREIELIPDDNGGVIACWIDLAADGGIGDLFTQRVDATGARLWGPLGVGVANLLNTVEHNARMVPDGSGGVFFAWDDNRLGYSTVHAEHVNAHGAGQWAVGSGLQVSAGESYRPQLSRDPVSGNVFYGYIHPGALFSPSYIAYARRGANGATVWGEQIFGVSYCDTVGVAADGVGGVAFAHHDPYYGVFVTRVANDLSVTWDDVKLGDPPAEAPFVTGDGRGGAVVAWRGVSADGYYSNTDYAQRVTLNGTMGQVLPRITQVVDVPTDEGGYVRLQAGAAGADALQPYDPTLVTGYGLWRRIEQSSLAPQAALGPADVADRVALTSRMRQGPVRLQADAAALMGMPPGAWESLGLYPAFGLASYNLLAPTRQDSSGTGRHREVFVISAHTTTRGLVGLSFADSGSSVDNLAPAPPTNLAGTYGAGALHLTWAASPAPDLAQYAIYSGRAAGFVPGALSLVGHAGLTSFADGAFAAGSYYKVTALDRHGNESSWAALTPAQTTGVGAGETPAVSFLSPVQPNPMREGGVIAFGLAREGDAELAVFDLSGRRVRMLARGVSGAGEHRVAWDGRDEQGRVLPGGLYWVRLTAPGIVATQKVVRAE